MKIKPEFNHLFFALVLTIQFMLPSCKSVSSEQNYIKVRGLSFYSGDKKFYPAGVNMWYAAYLGAKSVDGGRDRLVRELDILHSNGINNIRILGASEQSELQMGLPWGFETGPKKYDEELLCGLDFFLDELGKRDMYAIIFLNNYWQWSGGMAQYMAWQGKPLIDPDATGNWGGFMNQSAEFYSNDSANYLFQDYISHLVNRKNTINGSLYKDDPAIMSWQLANEPRPGTDGAMGQKNRAVFITWIDRTAGFIKNLDSNHLVSSGNEGLAGSIHDSSIYVDAHKSTNIDYLTFHLWPKNWGWFDVKNPGLCFDSTLIKTENYLEKHIAMADLLKKPLVLEEFGMERDSGKTLPGSSVIYRDKFYTSVLQMIEKNASKLGPLVGFNIWAWGGTGVPAAGKVNLKVGSEYMGDPLQEPQGLNSVFASDTSTLRIIHSFSGKLN